VRVVRVGGDAEFGPDRSLVEPLQPVEAEPAADVDPQDCRPDYLVRTVGFLVNSGPRFLSIAQEVLPDGDGFRAVTHIPRSIIEEVMTLTAGSDQGLPAAG
jgi:hypothetical protein